MIKAAIFDMDGLLIDSEPLWKRTNLEVYASIGIKLTEKDRAHMIGRRASENVAYFYHKHPWGGPTPEQVEQQIVDNMVRLVKQEGALLLPGVHKVLQICKQAKLQMAIASSSPQALIDGVVDTLKIREHFEHIYSAQFEPYGKPHPGVFISVADHFGVQPSECLVFEDAPSGVLAAKAAKMHCIAVPEPAYKDNAFVKTADVILDSLEQFDAEMLA